MRKPKDYTTTAICPLSPSAGFAFTLATPGFLEKEGDHLIVLTMPEESRKANLVLRAIAKALDFIVVAVLFKVIPQVGYLTGLIYLLICDGLFEGRSVGKKILKLKVVAVSTGNPGSFKESIVRNAILTVALLLFKIPIVGWVFLVLILALEFLLIVGNKDGMRLGDDLANTKVVEG